MIGLALSPSITNQRRTEASTHEATAIRSATRNEPVSTIPSTVAQAPMIMTPSSPRCQTPARCAMTPAMVT